MGIIDYIINSEIIMLFLMSYDSITSLVYLSVSLVQIYY